MKHGVFWGYGFCCMSERDMFVFHIDTLEYRNKTWSWLDFLNQIKKDAKKAVIANSGSLVKEKLLFQKRNTDLDIQKVPIDSDFMIKLLGIPQLQNQEKNIKSNIPKRKSLFNIL